MAEYDDDIYSEDDSELAIESSPEILDEADEYDDEYHPSVLWDYAEGDFALDGNGNMIECTGLKAYEQWCIKTILTERDACRAYNEDIGAELEAALAWDDHDLVEAALTGTIKDALMVNPRTQNVDEFTYEWDGDALTVTCVVTPVGEEEFTITI